ncbi:hypothetical protein PInf_007518 [Phytophthora infestans]|nr:hypothetical protein PInf_007518 [Phytophthora infestans]
MPSSTRPSAIAKIKAAAAPCPMLPRPVDVQAEMGLSDTTVDGLMDAASSAGHETGSSRHVGPVSGAHTSHVEGAWEIRIKQHIKAMHGMKKSRLPM